MNWFKKLFCGGGDMPKDCNDLPEITCDIPMPKVKPPKSEKDISEPVFAIVEFMKKYPSRFKLDSVVSVANSCGWSIESTVSDVKTAKVINFKQTYGLYSEEILSSDWKWLTQDELALLKDTFEEILQIKTERWYSVERAKMKEIYK